VVRHEPFRGRKGTSAAIATIARVSARLVLAVVLAVPLVVADPVPSRALTSTTIAINGNFDDWTGVRADPDNVARDTQVPGDPDWPGQPDRDLFYVNATYDSEYLYLCWRRTAGGVKAITFGAYLDLDGDGLLQENRDVVVAWTLSDPSQPTTAPGNYDAQGRILHYNQARSGGNLVYPAGDPMDHYGPPPTSMQNPVSPDWASYMHPTPHGDGNTPDGWALGDPSWGEDYPAKPMDAFMDPVTGIEAEARVAWTDLGFSAGQVPPLISIHFASGNGESFGAANKTSLWSGDYRVVSGSILEGNRGQVEDNVKGLYWLASRDVDVSPDRSGGGAAGTTLVYEHTVTNGGNAADVFDVAAVSSQGWAVEVVDAGGNPLSSVTLDRYASTTVYVRVTIPPGAADGTTDRTVLTASSQTDSAVTDSATDISRVGQVTVTPDQTASSAPGQYVDYTYTVQNNTPSAGTFDLATTSTLGFSNAVYDQAGSPLSAVALGSGESTTVVVRVSVPATATVGMQDVMRLSAELQGDPTVTSSATGTTSVLDGLTIVPDRSAYGGAGTWVQYTHTVTNSWPTTRTVSLSAASTQGWDVRMFASDGITPITSADVGPFGASEDIVVRVFVPTGTAEGTIDVTTVTASTGAYSDSVTDTTTVRRLSTYSDGGYINEQNAFVLGDEIFGRATGLKPGDDVYFVWTDADGHVVRTSPTYAVDTSGMAFDEYVTQATDPTGGWTLRLYDSKNNLLETVSFTVGFDAEITALSATDAPGIGDDVAVTSSLANHNTAAITDSTVTYVIWWDADGDGSFGAGDIYIDDTGAPVIWDGVSPVTATHVTASVDVAGGGTWTEAGPWTVSNSQFPNQGTYNVTATWTESDGTYIDDATTQFYSIPALGWPLFALLASGLAALMWRRRPAAVAARLESTLPPDRGGAAV